MNRTFVPKLGDLIWLTFDPQVGREQAGRRPALVISPKDYNQKIGLALVCPVTSKVKGYPFEVPTPADTPVSGVILADHVKSLDWKARNAVYICDSSRATTLRVLAMLESLVEG